MKIGVEKPVIVFMSKITELNEQRGINRSQSRAIAYKMEKYLRDLIGTRFVLSCHCKQKNLFGSSDE